MGNYIFEVVKPGLTTTIQDLGRTGYQQYGVVVAGAMDAFALQVGNLLVGNKRGEAGIEVVIMGPTLKVLTNTVIAICGADLSPKLDGESVTLWKSFAVKSGQTLTFGKPLNGAYAYIAVAGGIETPMIMESKSTYTKAELGGIEGRNLQKGDQIPIGVPSTTVKAGIGLPIRQIPDYRSGRKIRVILGPDHNAFNSESIDRFLSENYKLTSQSDRMGSRLEGPSLSLLKGADIISDAIFPGTIQVPANGQPIILLADRQTTGGYTRIATVITVDLPYVAQMLPGNELAFEAISVEKAQRLYVEQELLLQTLSVAAGVY
ncbi:biotin-dependent carboxyltransferase family protein [Oceanobacillus chungangensis]|uniref:KipI antagonist n=1 Tax=Oceanobacillus chungangensis TaxID=1229152 RepID=A0A3D8PHE4_9BACI|nr:biotin-dependent carboxyltransferase family protein [Oceanobacillus chungangensis]RDW15490.1 KipI antagonist [Oceanobacillus chungangensis]